MENKYEIRTVQDMVDCTTEENLDRFLVDLKSFLTTARMLKDLIIVVGEGGGDVNTNDFIWIDDGKHDSIIKN